MLFKGTVTFVSETFAYVKVGIVKIHFIMALKEPNYYIPALGSEIRIKSGQFVDKENIFLLDEAVVDMSKKKYLSNCNKEFLNRLIKTIKLEQFDLAEIIQIPKLYENIIDNIHCIALQSPETILINLLRNTTIIRKWYMCSTINLLLESFYELEKGDMESMIRETGEFISLFKSIMEKDDDEYVNVIRKQFVCLLNAMIEDGNLDYSRKLRENLIILMKVVEKFNNKLNPLSLTIPYRITNFNNCIYNSLTDLKLFNLWRYKHYKPNVAVNFENWSFYTYKSKRAEKCVALLYMNEKCNELSICDMHYNMLCFAINNSKENLRELLNRIVLIHKFIIVTECHIDSLINYILIDLNYVVVLSTSILNISSTSEVNYDRIVPIEPPKSRLKLSCFTSLSDDINEISYSGFVKDRFTDFKEINGTNIVFDNVTLRNCPNDLCGIIPMMYVMVKNVTMRDGQLLFNENTKIDLIGIEECISTLDIYNPNWWLNSSSDLQLIRRIPQNTIVIIKTVAIEILYFHINWIKNEEEHDVEVDMRFMIKTEFDNYFAHTHSKNILRIILQADHKRFKDWCQPFSVTRDYIWEPSDCDKEHIDSDIYRESLNCLIEHTNRYNFIEMHFLCNRLDDNESYVYVRDALSYHIADY